MGYVPRQSLENLKKYQYKGVDKCVLPARSTLSVRGTEHDMKSQICAISIRVKSVLELAGYSLAEMGCSEHRSFIPYVVCSNREVN